MRERKKENDKCFYSFFVGILVTTLLILLCIIVAPHASELRHRFQSPAFNGQGYSSHVLTIENLTHSRKQDIKSKQESEAREAERQENNSNINKFMRNFESRVYAELSKQLSEKLFGEDASESGTITILENTVTYETVGDEIQMTITKADGSTTTLVVPTGDFGF